MPIVSTPQCDECGKFMAWKNAYTFTPYGGPSDLEPPEEQIICPACLEANGGIDKMRKANWQGPWRMVPEESSA